MHPWDSNAFICLSLNRLSLDSKGLAPPTFGAATFCFCVLSVGMRFWFHWNFQLLCGVLYDGVNSFNFVRRFFVNCVLMACSLNLGFINMPSLLCFLLNTCGHMCSNFVSCLDVTGVFGQSTIQTCSGFGISWIRSNFQREFFVDL